MAPKASKGGPAPVEEKTKEVGDETAKALLAALAAGENVSPAVVAFIRSSSNEAAEVR